MTITPLACLVLLLFILLLFNLIRRLLDKLVMAHRQLDSMRDSRDKWREIANLRQEQKQ